MKNFEDIVWNKAAIKLLKILLAWEAGELSEQQAARAAGYNVVEMRQFRTNAIADAKTLAG